MSDKSLPLDAWHRSRGARMVPFAGYQMPIQYEGIIAEHRWTRESAGLFDVSHMGQLTVTGPDAAAALERLLPGDIAGLKPGKVRYSLLLNERGGIIDDLMVTNTGRGFYIVVNGATKDGDIAHLRQHLPAGFKLTYFEDAALLALQGPKATEALARLGVEPVEPGWPGPTDVYFMEAGPFRWRGIDLGISRSGYTGEDGFEISVPAEHAEQLAEALCGQPEVKPIGLGARDSLRLEAGLPLYGHDLDEETTPIEADLGFAISKRRREQGGFPGAARIQQELADGPIRRRVGLAVLGRQPIREGAMVVDDEGNEVGKVTSGGFSPMLEAPIAMAYVPAVSAEPGTPVRLAQRGKIFEARIVPMPFVPHRYHRKGAGP